MAMLNNQMEKKHPKVFLEFQDILESEKIIWQSSGMGGVMLCCYASSTMISGGNGMTYIIIYYAFVFKIKYHHIYSLFSQINSQHFEAMP